MNLLDMKCPKCGNPPEILIRNRYPCMGTAQIRCAYSCFKYGMSFHSGSEQWARETLIEKWKELISEDKQKGD